MQMEIESKYTFKDNEHKTWQSLYLNLEHCRAKQAVPEFSDGLQSLGINKDKIPDLDEVNKKLKKLTGWEGVPVKGLEDGASFFTGLANKKFPIGNFIRSPKDLSYTPEPDIFHDLYGHMPFFTEQKYADFCQDFGTRALKYIEDANILKQFETLFWFTIEFGLIETKEGKRIFGGGILSSHQESNYSLSDEPTILPFNLEMIRRQDYRIDQVQPILYILESRDQLFHCLDEFEQLLIH